MPLAPSQVRLCSQILPTGSQCRQFALRNRPWCHSHADSVRRERTAHVSQLVAKFPAMDLFEVAVTLFDILFQVQHKYLPPLHAYAIFEAALGRIDKLGEEAWVAREWARVSAARTAGSHPDASVNPHQDNRLQPSPVK